ncbi:MAG TPA: response regulator [Acetobacteraceae bacterium]|nr:response regulator [Acetobacteraceae bacterium]
MNAIAPRPGEQMNILLVDDQPAKLLSYEAILGELGENLLKANSANEALQHLLKNEIAVVLIDVCMPDLDGFELAAMIRDHPRFQRTAIIFVSAIMMSDLDRLRGYELGAVDYVPVPFTPELLRAKVRVFADLYRKTRQLELLNSELERRVEERTAELAQANAELEQRVEERTREREEALAQVHEMQKMESLGQLTGGVAHDFNNLLMVILGNLQLLRKRVPDEPRLARLIDGAIKGAERGATLTKRMLAFARRQELKPETVEVMRLIGGMEEMLRRTLGTTIQINIDLRHDLPAIRVDPNQLELALLNLTLNARDAMPLGGRLEIAARRMPGSRGPQGLAPGEYVCLAVADSGTGMDPATVKRATEPFFTTKGAGKGTGLGLSMVHGLAAQSGGAMHIQSRVGTGTMVELWLPTAERTTVEAANPLAARKVAGLSHRILVVDDDPLISSATVAMLEDLGHLATEVSSGSRALEAMRNGLPVDLVITDQAMPSMTGTELSRQIQQEWPDLPIILATGYADLPNGEEPGLPRLSKPYQQDELAAMITQVVGTVEIHTDNVIPLDVVRRA